MSNPPFGDFASWRQIAEILFAQNRRSLVALALTCRTFRAQFLREEQLLEWAGYDPAQIKRLASHWHIPYSRPAIVSMLVSNCPRGRRHYYSCYNCDANALHCLNVQCNPLCPAICYKCKKAHLESWINCKQITRRNELAVALARRGLTWRNDSAMCRKYADGSWYHPEIKTIDDIATRMAQMRFLHQCVDYKALEKLALTLTGGEFIRGFSEIVEQILMLSLPENTYPDIFPWENVARRCIWNAHPEYAYDERRIAAILAQPIGYFADKVAIP